MTEISEYSPWFSLSCNTSLLQHIKPPSPPHFPPPPPLPPPPPSTLCPKPLTSPLRLACQRVSKKIGYLLRATLSLTSSSSLNTLPKRFHTTALLTSAHCYMRRKFLTLILQSYLSFPPHHHSLQRGTLLLLKPNNNLFIPSPCFQSLVIRLHSPPGCPTTGGRLSMQWDIGKVGKRHSSGWRVFLGKWYLPIVYSYSINQKSIGRDSMSPSMVEICGHVMVGLACFPWNGGNFSVHDMVILLTEAYLTNFHINYMLKKIHDYYCSHYGVEVSNRYAFLTVYDLKSIAEAYEHGMCGAHGTNKRKQLLKIENRIICGDIDGAAGVLHLPSHWVSLIITFRPPKILYGDSLRNPMPPKKASAFWHWISHILSWSGCEIQWSKISIHPLSITIQQDPISCGLFALNAVSHHYLQQDSPLWEPDNITLAHCWMEIALELLHEGGVHLFLYRTTLSIWCLTTNHML